MPKTPIRSTDGVLLTDLAHRIAMAAGKRVPRESTVRALKRAGEVYKGPDGRLRTSPEVAATVERNYLALGFFMKRGARAMEPAK